MGATWARMCDQHHLRRARIVNFTDTRFPISGTRLEFMGKAGFPFPVIFDSPIVCVPRRRQDWKKDAGRRGGGQGDGVFKLRKPFLKRVVLDRYPHILR